MKKLLLSTLLAVLYTYVSAQSFNGFALYNAQGSNTTYHIIVVSIMVSIMFGGAYLYGRKQGGNYWTTQFTNGRNYITRSCSRQV